MYFPDRGRIHILKSQIQLSFMNTRFHSVVILFVSLLFCACQGQRAQPPAVSGDLMQWHRVTLSFSGPETSEQDALNPFTDYRMSVTFSKGDRSYKVPGFYAADGDAGQSGSFSGNQWQVRFSPDEPGEWQWKASFKQGEMIAINPDPAAETAIAFDGQSGTLTIAASDKIAPDNRARGRLNYVGKHYLQYASSEEYFIKAGADAPEVFLGYIDFDSTYQHDGGDNHLKHWKPHIKDWQPGDPTWRDGKGKGIIGAVNYLAEKGMNVFSFLTMNVTGDGKNVWPWTSHEERYRFDVSKLDQWEMVMDHADKKGMYLHFKTQETENDQLLDGGALGPERKLYYRELIARFGHHLALNWNLGEENTQTTQQQKDCAAYIRKLDPYQNHVVIHTHPIAQEEVYRPLLGDQSQLTGVSVQTNWDNVHAETQKWIAESARAGKPWVVANDEQGHFSVGVSPDSGWPGYDKPDNHDDIRKRTLWGNLMAGGGGVEYYFGYQNPESDLSCNDWRSRDQMWEYSRIALEFFREHLPFWEMKGDDERTSAKDDYCLFKEGEIYAVYLPSGGTTKLSLESVGSAFEIYWFNPRTGGDLQRGSIEVAQGPGWIAVGTPPADFDQDWVALVKRKAAQ